MKRRGLAARPLVTQLAGRAVVGIGTISGLSTVITGSYIQVLPGAGRGKSEFIGLESPPPTPERNGQKVTLVTTHLGSMRPGLAVYYRGTQVGTVTGAELSSDSTTVQINLFIFVTPEDPSSHPVKDGAIFVLHDKPEKEWLYWKPKISLPPAN